MTATYENGTGAPAPDENGMNTRVLLIAAASVALLFCWFVICAVTGMATYKKPPSTWSVTYQGPEAKPAPAQNPRP